MIGENIKALRVKNNMTQRELADKLYVTAQAVSRWESGLVEPSLSTIASMATIFNVSTDDILGVAKKNEEKPIVEDEVKEEDVVEEVKKEEELENKDNAMPSRYPIGTCEKCNKLIFEPGDLVREHVYPNGTRVICKECKEKEEKAKKLRLISYQKKQRIKGYVWSSIAFVISFILAIVSWTNSKATFFDGFFWVLVGIFMFTYVSCCLLKNNFIGDLTEEIFSWGFVKMPGVIFNLSLDGIIWLLTVKLGLWILSLALALLFGLLAVIVGSILSIFVYPFALIKSYKRPEEVEMD